MTKKLIFGALAGDLAGETAISILEKRGYPTTIFRLSEIEDNLLKTRKNIVVFFFTPIERYYIGSSKINPAAYFFLKEKVAEFSPFLIACNPSKIETVNFISAVTNLAERYLEWEREGFSTYKSNVFPPWGEIPTNSKKKELFWGWLREIEYLID